jgi:hypothetical protein
MGSAFEWSLLMMFDGRLLIDRRTRGRRRHICLLSLVWDLLCSVQYLVTEHAARDSSCVADLGI